MGARVQNMRAGPQRPLFYILIDFNSCPKGLK